MTRGKEQGHEGTATVHRWQASQHLGKLKARLGPSDDARGRPWSHMHTRRTPGARKPTDNDLERVKLWSSSIKS